MGWRFVGGEELGASSLEEDTYERFGVFPTMVGWVPVASDGARAATAWSAVWRVLVLLLGMMAFSVPQALYVVDTGGKPVGTPGVLGLLGVNGSTWWGVAVLFVVFALGGLAPFILCVLLVPAHFMRLRWPVPILLVLMVMVWAVIPGNLTGVNLSWWEDYRMGALRYYPTDNGLLGMLPGVVASMLSVLLVVLLWCTVGRALKRTAADDGRIMQMAYALTPGVCLGVTALMGMIPASGELLLGFGMLAVLLGILVPNELGACAWCIRTRREAYWMWVFAANILFECLLVVVGVISAIYGL